MKKINHLTSLYNFRDLGGYPTKDGKVTRYGKLFRSDGPDHITPEDIQVLVSEGVTLDIDLRGPEELEKWPDILGQDDRVEYLSILLLPSLNLATPPESLAGLYLLMLRESGAQFYQLFSAILKNKSAGTLFHCSVGKDRTGVTAAMLLLLADVVEEEVIRAYVTTAKNLKTVLARFKEINNPALSHFLTARPEDIQPFIEALNIEFGGVRSYLSKIGFTTAEIEALRSILRD